MENSINLQQEWQNMNAEFTAKDTTPAIATYKLDHQSHSLISSLLFKLKWKLRWIRIISVPMLVAAFFIKNDLQYLLLAFLVTYELCRILGLVELKKIKTAIDFNSNTKQVLEDNLIAIRRILRMENIFGYIFLPLSGPIGLIAYRLYVHQKFAIVFSLPNLTLQIGLCILIGIPFIILAKKMNDSIFKEPIKDLRDKIKELSA
ncbi:hypothetical protein EZ428_17670 [Pedobacter frigiditerrae]|uniref:Uncharacterized protein n=1 Tax=Pedobacter frigiditerrae TaxID=2530452 RepID=A0A4R0MRJ4_9SPHI|nr:hypothetical protein [Pedobacter frigiditerrae]TCC89520.1 hypothetical protein EZ428_17670 [Pedobacter frigiditerrae]